MSDNYCNEEQYKEIEIKYNRLYKDGIAGFKKIFTAVICSFIAIFVAIFILTINAEAPTAVYVGFIFLVLILASRFIASYYYKLKAYRTVFEDFIESSFSDGKGNPINVVYAKKEMNNPNKILFLFPKYSTQSASSMLMGQSYEGFDFWGFTKLTYITQSGNTSVTHFMGNANVVDMNTPVSFNVRTTSRPKIKWDMEFKNITIPAESLEEKDIIVQYDSGVQIDEKLFTPFVELVRKYNNAIGTKNVYFAAHDGKVMLCIATKTFIKLPKGINQQFFNDAVEKMLSVIGLADEIIVPMLELQKKII